MVTKPSTVVALLQTSAMQGVIQTLPSLPCWIVTCDTTRSGLAQAS